MAKAKRPKKDRRRQEIDDSITAKAARRVLSDVRVVKGDLNVAIENNDIMRTRIAWITAITLLRTVGHVLAKVDVRRATWLKDAINAKHRAVKQDPFNNLLFHEFIEEERNLVLKEYKASIFDTVKDDAGAKSVVLTNIQVGTEVFSPADAVAAAVRYWERYLDDVEERALAARTMARATSKRI